MCQANKYRKLAPHNEAGTTSQPSLSLSSCLPLAVSSVTLNLSGSLSSSVSVILSLFHCHSLSVSHPLSLRHTLGGSSMVSFSLHYVILSLHQSWSSFCILSSFYHTLTLTHSSIHLSFCLSIFHFICHILYLPFICFSLF